MDRGIATSDRLLIGGEREDFSDKDDSAAFLPRIVAISAVVVAGMAEYQNRVCLGRKNRNARFSQSRLPEAKEPSVTV